MSLQCVAIRETRFTNELLAVCPETGQQMATCNFAFEPISVDSDEVLIWWHCLTCQEWHVLLYLPENPS